MNIEQTLSTQLVFKVTCSDVSDLNDQTLEISRGGFYVGIQLWDFSNKVLSILFLNSLNIDVGSHVVNQLLPCPYHVLFRSKQFLIKLR